MLLFAKNFIRRLPKITEWSRFSRPVYRFSAAGRGARWPSGCTTSALSTDPSPAVNRAPTVPGVLHAGDQKLPLRHRHSLQHLRDAPQCLHPQHQSRPAGPPRLARCSFRPAASGPSDPLPHLHVGPAAGHVHRHPAQLRNLQQHMVADVLPIQGEAETPPIRTPLFSRDRRITSRGTVSFPAI